MTAVWLTVGLVGAASIAMKASGPALLGEQPLPGPFARLVDLLAPALLAALVATQTFGTSDRELVLDERAAGLAAAAVAVALRAPILVAALAAAVTTALLRAI